MDVVEGVRGRAVKELRPVSLSAAVLRSVSNGSRWQSSCRHQH
jgi:hypothetical protein